MNRLRKGFIMKTFTMRKLFFTLALGSVSAFLLLNSCSSGGGDGGTSAVTSTLDEENIQVLSENILVEGDCIAISGLSQSKSLYTVSTLDDSLVSEQKVVSRAPYPINRVVYGLISGSVSKDGEHNSGTDSLTYNFDDFTNPSGDLKFGVSGAASVVDHGQPGDYGPIMSNKTIDTQGKLNVTKSSYNRAASASYECEMSGFNQIYATVLFSQDDLNIKRASAKNIQTGDEYIIDNFTAQGYFADDEVVLTNVKTSYTDPQVGTIVVTSDQLNVKKDSVKIPSSAAGTLILTATDGTEAELVITHEGNIKVYKEDGTQRTLVTELDCSGLVH